MPMQTTYTAEANHGKGERRVQDERKVAVGF